jgi:voltage-dependent potassium channel beta subunit
MEYRNLGKAGIKLSALSLGAWVTYGGQVGEDVAYECMTAAYEAGVNFFDNAEAYADGNAEVVMGNVIRRTGWTRTELVISTKLFWGGDGPNNSGLSYKHISQGIDASLKRLQMDYVDLLFCHRPDKETPIEETVWAMNQAIRQGKAFYWGTSEWSATEIMEAYGVARREHLIPPTMEQPQYHMFHRQKVESEFLRLYREIGLGTTIWSPLASGLLTGKYKHGIPKGSRLDLEGYDWLKNKLDDETWKKNFSKLNDLDKIAKELGGTLSQLAIAWCLRNPNVSTVITGASKADQVRENMKALEVYRQIDDEVMRRIDEILENKPEGEPNYR